MVNDRASVAKVHYKNLCHSTMSDRRDMGVSILLIFHPYLLEWNLNELRKSLIQKYTLPPVSNADPILGEIENDLKLDVSCDDH
jgi:hypothetical protein